MNIREDLPPESRQPATFCARLVHRAARRTPHELAARLEEEWLADLAAQTNGLARLRFALGCWRARHAIALDPLAHGARLGVAGGGTIDVAELPHGSLLPKRAAVLLLIVAFHVVVALAFIFSGPIIRHLNPPKVLTGTFIFDPPPVTPPLPLPRPGLSQKKPGPRDLPPMSPIAPIVDVDVEGPVMHVVAEPTAPASVRVQGGAGKGFPATEDYYPAGSIRLGESGLAAVNVCVDERGRLTSTPTIARTSGSWRLDDGALALARAGSGHYRPTMENGKPIPACFAIGVRFALKG